MRTQIKPAPRIQVAFKEVRGDSVGEVDVARGDALVHFLNGIIYIRVGSADMPAQPEDLDRLIADRALVH